MMWLWMGRISFGIHYCTNKVDSAKLVRGRLVGVEQSTVHHGVHSLATSGMCGFPLPRKLARPCILTKGGNVISNPFMSSFRFHPKRVKLTHRVPCSLRCTPARHNFIRRALTSLHIPANCRPTTNLLMRDNMGRSDQNIC